MSSTSDYDQFKIWILENTTGFCNDIIIIISSFLTIHDFGCISISDVNQLPPVLCHTAIPLCVSRPDVLLQLIHKVPIKSMTFYDIHYIPSHYYVHLFNKGLHVLDKHVLLCNH
jgi:hypothetical protein